MINKKTTNPLKSKKIQEKQYRGKQGETNNLFISILSSLAFHIFTVGYLLRTGHILFCKKGR